ncbi:hypothetical protein GA0115255_112921, partial [Streptomyces sp. Ncost-T6T-2b]
MMAATRATSFRTNRFFGRGARSNSACRARLRISVADHQGDH